MARLRNSPRPPDLSKVTPEIIKLAKTLSVIYRNRLKARAVYSSPWPSGVPIEKQRLFGHFLSAATIVDQEDASPKDFINAQFAGLEWTKNFPFPAQLATCDARLRYMAYMERKHLESDREVSEDDFLIDSYEYENRKLKKMMGSDMTEAEVLKIFRREFSREFLRSKKKSA